MLRKQDLFKNVNVSIEEIYKLHFKILKKIKEIEILKWNLSFAFIQDIQLQH